jgi:hypothetical protein
MISKSSECPVSRETPGIGRRNQMASFLTSWKLTSVSPVSWRNDGTAFHGNF